MDETAVSSLALPSPDSHAHKQEVWPRRRVPTVPFHARCHSSMLHLPGLLWSSLTQTDVQSQQLSVGAAAQLSKPAPVLLYLCQHVWQPSPARLYLFCYTYAGLCGSLAQHSPPSASSPAHFPLVEAACQSSLTQI